jgi:hypothetical protein
MIGMTERSWSGRWVRVAIAFLAMAAVVTAIARGIVRDGNGEPATPARRGGSSGDAAAVTGADAARSRRPPCGPTRGPFRPGRWPGGCWRPYGPHSPFNQPLPVRPRLAADSAEIVRRLLDFGAIQNAAIGIADTPHDFGHPVYFAGAHDPRYTLRCDGRYGRCPLDGRRARVPARAQPAAGADAHLAVVDQRTGREDDLFEVTAKPRRGGVLRFTFGGSTTVGGSGLRAGATAAGFGLLAGIIRAAELERGEIRHALLITVLCDSGRPVYPAAGIGGPCSALGRATAGAPHMGTRLQLALSSRAISLLPTRRWVKAILHAMARYGMFVSDTGGSSWGLQLESGTTYTSFGYPDPLIAFARRAGLPRYQGHYVLSLRDVVNWRRLRVIAPCVSARRC